MIVVDDEEEEDRMEPTDLIATDVMDETDGKKVALMDKLIGDAIMLCVVYKIIWCVKDD